MGQDDQAGFGGQRDASLKERIAGKPKDRSYGEAKRPIKWEPREKSKEAAIEFQLDFNYDLPRKLDFNSYFSREVKSPKLPDRNEGMVIQACAETLQVQTCAEVLSDQNKVTHYLGHVGCTLFPSSRFYPTGFYWQGFNEADTR